MPWKNLCTHRGNNKLWKNRKKNNFSYTNKSFPVFFLLFRLSCGNKSFLVTFPNTFLSFHPKALMEFKWYFFVLLCCTLLDLREHIFKAENFNGFGASFASSRLWEMHSQMKITIFRHKWIMKINHKMLLKTSNFKLYRNNDSASASAI